MKRQYNIKKHQTIISLLLSIIFIAIAVMFSGCDAGLFDKKEEVDQGEYFPFRQRLVFNMQDDVNEILGEHEIGEIYVITCKLFDNNNAAKLNGVSIDYYEYGINVYAFEFLENSVLQYEIRYSLKKEDYNRLKAYIQESVTTNLNVALLDAFETAETKYVCTYVLEFSKEVYELFRNKSYKDYFEEGTDGTYEPDKFLYKSFYIDLANPSTIRGGNFSAGSYTICSIGYNEANEDTKATHAFTEKFVLEKNLLFMDEKQLEDFSNEYIAVNKINLFLTKEKQIGEAKCFYRFFKEVNFIKPTLDMSVYEYEENSLSGYLSSNDDLFRLFEDSLNSVSF